ncbi:F-box/LRR-repeat protein 15-like [Ptychodera flava]|uniref:F-box/LRR-repeat protein 15-like n=1 Tax=Ptychodera flava TaxID=63121 RepID=UPI00396A52E0
MEDLRSSNGKFRRHNAPNTSHSQDDGDDGYQDSVPVNHGCTIETCKRCSSEYNHFTRLPDEILVYNIVSKLETPELCLLKLVCKRFHRLVEEYFRHMRALDLTKWNFMITQQGLNHIIKHASCLLELRLDRCWTAATEANLLTIAKRCQNLRALTLSMCKSVTDFAVTVLSQNCTQLEELDLSSCFMLSDEGVCNIARFCQHLRELHLSSDYGVTDISVRELAENCHSLEELDVSYCYKVTNSSVREFVTNQKSSLKLLRIKNCTGVTQDVVEKLFVKGITVNNMF